MLQLRAFALILATAVPLLAQPEDGGGEGWTPALAMSFRSVESTALSADGEWVAYVVRTPEMEGERSEYVSEIWVARSDGSRSRRYTYAERSSTAPAFSADGTRLAFLSSADRDRRAERRAEGDPDEQQIWVLPLHGGEAERVTDAPASIDSFAWSPDGRRIAYLMADPKTEEQRARKKEKRDVELVDQEHEYNHLYVVELAPDEAGERAVTRLTEGAFHVSSFDWSPDGTVLVFAHQPDPRLNTGFSRGDLAQVASTGGEVKLLLERDGVDATPLYSPDGEWIAFTSDGGRVELPGLDDVFLLPASGGAPRPLGRTPDRQATLVGWRPDGGALLLSEAKGTTTQLYALPVDGDEPLAITAVQGVIRAPSIARRSGRLAFTYETSDQPAEVYTSTLGKTDDMVRLSALHEGIRMPPMGSSELMRWSSADEREIEGLLTYPVGYQPGRPYPLILSIHGGPSGVYSQTFTGRPGIYQYQFFAQRGYAILRPNPRGSSGYGKEFRYANIRDWGHGDYEDVMAGVDRVIELGIADPEQLFVMGWSYGGYMTSYVVTRTGRFRAASMGAGLPNLVSMVHTTDIPDYLAAHMGAELWEDYAVYEKHSAMYRIANVTTPTQVIHGSRDLRVPFTQGQELYVALDRRGVPTEMVVYPRTPHGPREPKLLMDVSPRILAWFERFRGGAQRATEPTGASP